MAGRSEDVEFNSLTSLTGYLCRTTLLSGYQCAIASEALLKEEGGQYLSNTAGRTIYAG